MFTSVTNKLNRLHKKSDRDEKSFDPLKTGMSYLIASIVIAAAAAVYGMFSHGVYSYFMTYAFMVPLLGGALPHLMAAVKSAGTHSEKIVNESEELEECEEPDGLVKIFDAKETQLAVIVTLTAGSLLKGVLDIYGTTNRLLIVYPVIAAIILAAALAGWIKRSGSMSKLMKNS